MAPSEDIYLVFPFGDVQAPSAKAVHPKTESLIGRVVWDHQTWEMNKSWETKEQNRIIRSLFTVALAKFLGLRMVKQVSGRGSKYLSFQDKASALPFLVPPL